jgi:alcohol dehydrogenase (cytochrome c)
VPKPGEPAAETWQGNQPERRGGATWLTGTYDPQFNLVYWPAGNPGPTYNGDERRGDNLYEFDPCSRIEDRETLLVLSIHAARRSRLGCSATAGACRYDWQGRPRKLLLQANRNGFFYVLDRSNGELLWAKQFLEKLNWAKRSMRRAGRF